MKGMSLVRCLGLACAVALALLAPGAVLGAESKTLDNLMAAYDGESNAHAKYLAYAEKADKEGYGKVASLFRAAAMAEEIHAKTHAEVIQKMGGTPKAEIKPLEVKSTKENLEDALRGESYERDTMYPDFLKQARAERNKDAMKSFNYALATETEYAKFYQEALANLDAWKGGKMDWYVCPTCGYTVKSIEGIKQCPVCFTPVTDYKKVS